MMKNLSLLLFGVLFLSSCQDHRSITVKNLEEFNNAVSAVQPGDVIQLANGVWKDTELLFEGLGTEEKPITLRAQEKGKVSLEGESSLHMAGEYLIVEGLVFKNGFTPGDEVISLKREDGVYANHCRLTECVIDGYNSNQRLETEAWVALYGKNNRVDHCYFTNKQNHGVVLAIKLVDSLCRQNQHLIDHNFFGFRQNYGGNGGETIRIGTSTYSLTESRTTVSNNYFYHCNGEHEIISNKSCWNVFRDNTFYECKGTLTFRHGNDNLVESNVFLGNGKPHTGGIRIINKRNRAINNYHYELKGVRFRSAMVVMNGRLNTAINGYHQVVEGEFLNNSYYNCDQVRLCAASPQVTETPLDSRISNNLFYHEEAIDIFTVDDDISGIEFSKNYVSGNIIAPNISGVESLDIDWEINQDGIYRPENTSPDGPGSTLEKLAATPENTGVSWYPRVDKELLFDVGEIIPVKPGLNTLNQAVSESEPGDILVLEEGGEYLVNESMFIEHPVTIKTENIQNRAGLKCENGLMFIIEDGGSLKLGGLEIDGSACAGDSGNSIVRTSETDMNRNYKFIIEDCNIKNLNVGHSYDFFRITEKTFADTIIFRNCNFENISGNVLALDKVSDEIRLNNAEYVGYENCSFNDVEGSALVMLQGGGVGSFGPDLLIDHCIFNNIGHGERNGYASVLTIHGAQILTISNSIFMHSKPVSLSMSNDGPVTLISNCNFFETGEIQCNNDNYQTENIYSEDPGSMLNRK